MRKASRCRSVALGDIVNYVGGLFAMMSVDRPEGYYLLCDSTRDEVEGKLVGIDSTKIYLYGSIVDLDTQM